MPKVRKLCWIALIVGALALGGCAWLFPPLQATLVGSPSSGTAPLVVTFTLAANKPVTGFTLLTPGADVPLQTGSSLPTSVVRTYASPGSYIATLNVQDGGGQTATAQTAITVGSPPVVPPVVLSFTAPQTESVGIGVNFAFTARAGGAGRRLVEYRLWFGDGESHSEPVNVPHPQTLSRTMAHAYTQTGSYTATLRVYDDLNVWAEQTRSIVIEP